MHGFAQALHSYPDYFLNTALQAALDLELPERLSAPRQLADLAAEHGWSLHRLLALVRAAQDANWAEKLSDGRWQWRYTGPAPAPQVRQHWGRLAETIATDQPVDCTAYAKAYQQSMATAHAPLAAHWAQLWVPTLPAQGQVLDVGAGLGTWSLAVLSRLSAWQATQVDREALADLAPAHPRVLRLVADATALPCVAPAELAVAAHLLHHLGDGAARQCVGQMVNALKPEGWISVVEVFELPGQASPNIARWFDLDMAVYSPAGRVRPLADILALLAEAGCAEPAWRLLDPAAGVAEVYGRRVR